MLRIAIADVLSGAATEKTVDAKVAFLQKHSSVPLKQVLRLIYDESIEFLLPDTKPPYKENDKIVDLDTMLYREARRLRIFFKGGGYDNLNQNRREMLFIQLLEEIDPKDSKILSEHVICHKAVKGLTKKTLETAFPTIFTDPLNFK
tara:strand:+ start:803 stop:1243 length:441 start_codon:yes stop_codon:yes gene_type:complete